MGKAGGSSCFAGVERYDCRGVTAGQGCSQDSLKSRCPSAVSASETSTDPQTASIAGATVPDTRGTSPKAGELWLSRPPYLLLTYVRALTVRANRTWIEYELLDDNGSLADRVDRRSSML